MKKKIGLGIAAVGVLAGLSALTVAILKKRQNEEVYREAELKAMQELDEMLTDESDCADCTCAEECNAYEAEAEVCEEAEESEEAEPEEEAEKPEAAE